MFPLYTKTFPANAVDLAALLNASVKRVFAAAANPVTVRDKAYPQVAEIRITLDNAELRSDPPRPPSVPGAGAPALQLDELHILGKEMAIGPALADLRLGARDVSLKQAPDLNGEIVLILQRAADGEVEISAATDTIENAIAALAKREAGKHGVTIDTVELAVRSRGARSVDAEVRLGARKLFFSTTVRIAAALAIDDNLNARVSDLACHGEGAIGALACNFLQPHLTKLDGRSFSLL
ncbi:MAG TPA: hypothetical protein VF551_09650, partial [Chthoniobacterales bacterium]